MEGMIQGGLGAVAALVLLFASHRVFLHYIQNVQNFILKGLQPEFFSHYYIVAYLFGGLLLGMIGSMTSLRKYAIY
jgi:cell division transport system permease protein